MVASSLQDDLLRIPGVEGAEVDGSYDAPAGLRIRIAQGADQDAVGGAIRRVLSAHGLGTDTQLPGEISDVPTESTSAEAASSEPQRPVSVLTADEPPTPIIDSESAGEAGGEGRTIIDLTDNDPTQSVDAEVGAEASAEGSADEPSDPIEDSGLSSEWDPEHLPPFVEARQGDSEDESPDTSGDDDPASSHGAGQVARIDSIAVVEGRSGIIIAVTASDGTETSVAASSTEGGVEKAVVKATAQLIDQDAPDPIVVEIEDRRVNGVDIVMVVLDADGTLVTGSAVVSAGRAFALGRATWAALAL